MDGEGEEEGEEDGYGDGEEWGMVRFLVMLPPLFHYHFRTIEGKNNRQV